jgi:hypothetical protein
MISEEVRKSWERCPVSTTQCTFTSCVDGCELESMLPPLQQRYEEYKIKRRRYDLLVTGIALLVLAGSLGYCAWG